MQVSAHSPLYTPPPLACATRHVSLQPPEEPVNVILCLRFVLKGCRIPEYSLFLHHFLWSRLQVLTYYVNASNSSRVSLYIDHRFIQWLNSFFIFSQVLIPLEIFIENLLFASHCLVSRLLQLKKKNGHNKKKMCQDPNTTTDKPINGVQIPDYCNLCPRFYS